ncbi:hypothetical protein ACIA8R_29945 [Nonomuraea sp. NPDC051191]|uniref:hypothetical protein n=1 Tax=Nonomuraea sp. NPDC051191 TaxID=3364372 RepID=UPI0037B00613
MDTGLPNTYAEIHRQDLLKQVTPTAADHVLWLYRGFDAATLTGKEPGNFTRKLMHLIKAADPGNRRRLGLGFPDYVAAMDLLDLPLDQYETNIAALAEIARPGSVGERHMNELEHVSAPVVVPTPEEWQPGDLVIDNDGRLFVRATPQGEEAGWPWGYPTEHARAYDGGPVAPDGSVEEGYPTRPLTLLVRDGRPAPSFQHPNGTGR